MKKLLLALGICVFLLGNAGSAQAGHWWDWWYDDGYYYDYYNPYYSPRADYYGRHEYGYGPHATSDYYSGRHNVHHGYHWNPESGWHGGTHHESY